MPADLWRYADCFGDRYATGHVWLLRTGRTLCGKPVRGRNWHDGGFLCDDDEPSCKICLRILQREEAADARPDAR